MRSASGVRRRLPMRQPLSDQLGASPIVPSVQDAHVLGIGAQVNTGRPRVDLRVSVRTSCPVPGGAIGGLESDLSRPVQLRRVRVPGPFAFPIVEDAGGSFLSFAASLRYRADRVPSSCHERPPSIQCPLAVSRDAQEAHGRRLLGAALRQGKLPPHPLDAGCAPLVLDRLPKLLIDDSHLGSGGRVAVAYARETEEIAWKLCAARMKDECSAHSEGCTEETGFEDHVVSRRRLAGCRVIGCGWAIGRPVVVREHERREIDLTRQLEEPLQCRGPRIE